MLETLIRKLGLWDEGYNEVALSFEGSLEHWQWALVGIAGLMVLVYSWQSSNRLAQTPRRVLLTFLRLIAVILVVLIFTQPALNLLNVISVKTRVLVLVDNSISMNLPSYAKGPSRIDDATKWLPELNSEKLREKFDVELYTFDKGLKRMDASVFNGGAGGLVPSGQGTDILEALKDASSHNPETISSIIMFSDGADNASFAGDDEGRAERVKTELEEFPVPVTTVLTGSEKKIKDLAIEEVAHADYGFIRNALDIEVSLNARGIHGVTVPITLKQGGKILASAQVKMGDKDGETIKAQLSFVPDRVGKYLYTLSVPVFEGEAIEENNFRQFTMKILRDKIRILHVTGSPSWDVRFLRDVLKQEPAVDLISFYILREMMDRTFTQSQSELSLIPFPVHRLFDIDRDLKTFDLVIFQNFDSDIYLSSPVYLENIRDYVVEEGGGFWMLGGDRAFSEGRYQGTPVDEILPISMAAEQPYVYSDFKAQVTPDGKRHPISMLAASGDSNENEATWNSLPELSGFNTNLGLKADAIALAVHPHEAVMGENLPIIAVREAGRGRTMAIASDSLWHWSFIKVSEGGTSSEYVTFVRNAIRWLTGDPEHRRVAISTFKSTYHHGETVEARIRALDRNYRPVDDVEIDLKLVDPTGNETDIETMPDGDEFKAAFKPELDGGYVLKAKAFAEGKELGSDQVPFTVEYSALELKNPWPDPELMKSIASSTGGEFYTLPKLPGASDIPAKKAEKIAGKKPIPLWDTMTALIIIAGIFCSEWYLRKRWGLY